MQIEEKIQTNFELSSLNTWHIGGPAKFFIEVKEQADLADSINWAKQKGFKYHILGGGSNILISDLGVDGLVIKLVNNDATFQGERVNAGAGAILGKIVTGAMTNSLAGIDWAIGIPGTLGGAIRGNAGAYGSSISDVVETIEAYSAKTGKFYKLSNRDCEFSYRGSLFKTNDDLVIWRAILRLSSGDSASIRVHMEELMNKRNQGQPKLPNAGCVFKNLVVERLREQNENLAEKAQAMGLVKGGKVGAGWIIDQLDLKGKSIGDAKVSLEHANFIVNTSKATAVQVVALISYIKQQARDRFGVQLEEEIQYFGF